MSDENAGSGQRYVLLGRSLTYRLSPFRPRNRSEPTWEVAHCNDVARQRPAPTAILGQCGLSDIPITLLPRQEADTRLATLQGKTARWDRQIPASPTDEGDDNGIRQHRALVLVQLMEALLIAADRPTAFQSCCRVGWRRSRLPIGSRTLAATPPALSHSSGPAPARARVVDAGDERTRRNGFPPARRDRDAGSG
jgi:hypothetical protein